jgi:coenzyme F420-reducing hydrogenase beta subunit
VLDQDICNKCDACIEYCPVLSSGDALERERSDEEKSTVFAAWSNDTEVHVSSSSGGIFSELARHVLEQSGQVCGCEWGEDWTPVHVLVDDWDGVKRLRGSKYIPSYIGHQFYSEIVNKAESGTTVLFCGTPCQVAGLSRIASPQARDKLILVDLVCHGVPSLESFWLYLKWKFGGKDRLDYFSFRSKEISAQTICAIDKQNNRYLAPAGDDPWFRAAMVYHLYLQRSCFDCKFGDKFRFGDISLGDFWGIPSKWHDPKGDSLVLANTAKGISLIETLAQNKRIMIFSSTYETASANVRRITGAKYNVPLLRSIALLLIKRRFSFVFGHKLLYLPLKIRERLISFLRRHMRMLAEELLQQK